jgi:hypothetical protein
VDLRARHAARAARAKLSINPPNPTALASNPN